MTSSTQRQVEERIEKICARSPQFADSYRRYQNQFDQQIEQGVLSRADINNKNILDWESGGGAFSAVFVARGAAHVTGIDSWLDTAYTQEVLHDMPRAEFLRVSLEDFAQDSRRRGAYDLVFANTVTEHMLDLPRLLTLCYQLLKPNGLLIINHDNYYQPVGSHDHGFLFYGNNREIVFRGPKCWETPTKCLASQEFRRTISKELWWTWNETNESQLTPADCSQCPYYRRAQPWAHLLYRDQFRQVFPNTAFTTGYPRSSLNKVTPFQLRQFLIEAGFDVERWVANPITNKPPSQLLQPPFNFSHADLCISIISVRCRRGILPNDYPRTESYPTPAALANDSSSTPLVQAPETVSAQPANDRLTEPIEDAEPHLSPIPLATDSTDEAQQLAMPIEGLTLLNQVQQLVAGLNRERDETRDIRKALQEAHEQLAVTREELDTIQGSRSYRVVKRIRQSRIGRNILRVAGLLLPREGGIFRAVLYFQPRATARHLFDYSQAIWRTWSAPNTVLIRPVGKRNPLSQAEEVWLLAIDLEQMEPYNLFQIQCHGSLELRESLTTPSGFCLFSSGAGLAQLNLQPGMRLVFMTHPWSGIVEIRWKRQRRTYDLHTTQTGTLVVDLDSGDAYAGPPSLNTLPAKSERAKSPAVVIAQQGFSKDERIWIERLASAPRVVSVGHPEWRGIHSSASQLFEELYEMDDNLDEQRGLHFARLFAEAHCKAIVMQGFPLTYLHLVNALRHVAPQLPIYVIWHGNFLQTCEDYNWKSFETVAQLCNAGKVDKWGFVKNGMAEVMAAHGFKTGFIMNMVNTIPLAPSVPLEGGPHLGIWSLFDNWRKPPYAMLAAASLLHGAIVHSSGSNLRARELSRLLKVQGSYDQRAIQQTEMPARLSQMHLNLSVTLSECAPMLPLESLAVGAPCLLGPNSHYFQDNEYLHQRLVVAYPDSGWEIARQARIALEERELIIKAYQAYAPEYNERARASLRNFLDME